MRHLYIIFILCFFIPSVSSASEAQTAQDLVTHLNNNDVDGVYGLFNMQGFSNRIATKLFDDEKEVKDFNRSFLKQEATLRQTIYQLFNAVKSERIITFLRLLNEDGKSKPLIRFSYGDEGVEYAILELDSNDKIVDIFFASKGKTSTEATAQLLRLSINPTAGLLSRILGKEQVNKELLETFRDLFKLTRQGNLQEAYTLLMSLPQEVRESESIIDFALLLATQLDEPKYIYQLSRLAELYGDSPNAQFMLIDHYFYTEQYDRAMSSIDRMIARLGADGALLELKSSIAMVSGDTESATAFIQQAMETEPSYEDSYWAYIEILMGQQDFSQVLKTLDYLTSEFGYIFTRESLESVEFYNPLTRSEVYESWQPAE